MEDNLRRFFRKKRVCSFIFIIFVIFLTGCSMNTTPITAESPGFFNHFLVYPFSWLLMKTALIFGDSYGFSIILVTILIRVMLLPVMIKQTKNMKAMQQLQPKINELKEKYSDKDEKTQKKLQEEMINLFQAEGVNPISSGCLPVLIQMPILLAFYYAIMRTEEIARHSFLWFDLGAPDPFYILPVLAAVTTFIQMKVSAVQSSANNQLAVLNNIMPLMILFFAINFPSALSLYWVVGGVFGIVQTYFINADRSKPEQETVKS